VESVVAEPVGRQRVDARRGDIRSVAAELSEADVVEDDEDDVGCRHRSFRLEVRVVH
jgi:hypothetical protein